MFDPGRYTIGWVCAIPVELVAARLHLDEEHDSTEYEAAPDDINTYLFGSIGKHNIVIATLPKGEYGISSAANAASNLIRSFSNVRIGLMVGIGGGAPLLVENEKSRGKQRQDVRLGDVVVSTPVNGKGGVYQYDYGKAIQGQGFLVTGHLNAPPTSILAAVTVLSTDFELNGNSIDTKVATILASRPRLQKKYQRPDNTTDRLYKSSFIHPDGDETCLVTCNGDEQTIKRPSRNEDGNGDDEDVVVHYGLVASANTLMKNATIRDTLAKDYGVLCFEMEAAGLMNQLPFLVVRGICDYSDSHKNELWQGYAAMTAAAYTKQLLLRLAPAKVKAELQLSEIVEFKANLKDTSSQINHVVTQLNHNDTKALQSDIERWLVAPDPSSNHNEACRLRHGDTGSWILINNTFRQWQKGKFPILWIYGISGCGKTILASTIIESLRRDETSKDSILYFYFDAQNSYKQRLVDVLRSFIKQLSSLEDTPSSHLELLYESCKAGPSQPTTQELNDCFMKMVKDRPTAIVLDALDESTTLDEVLDWIKQIRTIDDMKLITTSRTNYDVGSGFADWIANDESLEITGGLLDADIAAFIHYCIHDPQDKLKRWRSRPDIQQKIETYLSEKADGMFRWVECQLDVLRRCVDPRSVERALESLPAGLNETYDRILQGIPPEMREYVVRVLQFLVYSRRPPQLKELADLVVVQPDENPAFREYDRMPDPKEIAWCCASLTRIVTRPVNEYETSASALLGGGELPEAKGNPITELQLAHTSVKDYLLSNRPGNIFKNELEESRASSSIVRVSLAYLYEASRRPQEDKLERLPFEQFAAQSWLDRARSAEREGKSVLDWIFKLFMYNDFYDYWLDILDQKKGKAGPLYYASLGGLAVSAKTLLEKGADVNQTGGTFHHALIAASSGGHTDIVKLLLSHGADINATSELSSIGNALYIASGQGHVEVVQLLLDEGCKAEGRGSTLWSLLQNAIMSQNVKIVRLLLDNNADIEEIGGGFLGSLETAAALGPIEVVQALLDHGAQIRAQGGWRNGPLQAACELGDVGIVKLLLKHGADVHAAGGYSGNAIGAAARGSTKGHVEILKLLLKHGAKVDEFGSGVGTALQGSSYLGFLETVKVLLDNGADINMNGSFMSHWAFHHGTPLHHASGQGHMDIVKVLLDRGADVNKEAAPDGHDDKEATPVHAASKAGHALILKLLIEKGASVDSTALQFASKNGHVDIVKILLDMGVKSGEQALLIPPVSEKGHDEMKKLLDTRGIKYEVKESDEGDKNGGSCGVQ